MNNRAKPFLLRIIFVLMSAWLSINVQAHNLDTGATSIHFADDFLATMGMRGGLGQTLVQVGDEFWVVVKTTPGPGTDTGVGGYQTLYVPPGMQLLDAAHVLRTSADPRGFVEIPIKGQSPIAIGDGPVGASAATGLTGFMYPGPNVLGVNEAPVTAGGVSRGTVAGVYADTGIFFSTDPRTEHYSYTGPVMNNNSGDDVGELDNGAGASGVTTLWDISQLRAFGRKDVSPIIDTGDGRGNAPWGMASAVAGPQSGYQWSFNDTYYDTNPSDPDRIRNSIETGPWNRIQYPGSQISNDQAGLESTALGYAGIDGSTVGYDLNPTNPLERQGDGTGVNAVRFAIGQLEIGKPLWSAVKMKIVDPIAPNCYEMYADAFGGDAGGTSNGKDHIWRYFDPTVVTLTPCVFLQKQASKPFVVPGETFSYTITFANNGTVSLPNVTLTDSLPSGVAFVSAVPAPDPSTSYTWSFGTVPPNTVKVITLYVEATGSGTLSNQACVNSNGSALACATETVESRVQPYLEKSKSVSTGSIAPGGTLTYTMTVDNSGTGPSSDPIILTDYLPAGFTYQGLGSATLNGASITPTVDSSDPTIPIFAVDQGIDAGKQLVIEFTALVGASVTPGSYCNGLELETDGIRQGPVPDACVFVGGGQIGDIVWRDWDGDGIQDAGEEGMAGVTVDLFNDVNGNGVYDAGTDTPAGSQVTDANGNYLFTGLSVGDYVVVSTPPSGYDNTGNPPGGVGDPLNEGAASIVGLNDQVLTVDFGYQYDINDAGAVTIGDLVYSDLNKSGVPDAGEPGIPNVTVDLYEDTNGNGVIDAGDLLVQTTSTGVGGTYLFTGLDPNVDYIADVDGTDPDISSFFGIPFEQTSPDTVSVTSFTGSSFDDADYGFFGVLPATIGDQVFLDVDKDGIYNTGDLPIANITVEIYQDTNGDGIANEPVYDTAVTDLNGQYLFDNLGAGTYIVKVLGSDPDLIPGTGGTIDQHIITVASGDTNLTADFPYTQLLDKSVDSAFVAANDILTYTLTPSYPGSTSLSNVQVVDSVPAGTTYNGNASPTPFSEPSFGGTGDVQWNLGSTTAAVDGAGSSPSNSPLAVTRSSTTEVDDVFLNQDKPAEWKGADNTLVTRPETLKQKTSLLKFTLPTLAAGDTIDRAFVRVYVTGARPTNHSITMRRLTTAWTEGSSNANGATWSDPNGTGTAGTWSAGSFSAADYDGTVSYGTFAAPFTAATVLEFDVTDLVEDWRAGTVPNNGVALIASGTDAGDLVFRSSEGDAVATPGPRLVVSYSQSGTGTRTVRDNFTTLAYENNDGSREWAGGWVESGDDGNPNGGELRINSGILRVSNEPGVSIYREVNLLGASSATLTYDLTLNDLDAAGDVIKLQGSTNGGGAWTDIQTFTQGTALTGYTHDLVSVLGSVNEQTQLRFVSISDDGDTQNIEVDNFQISYATAVGAPVYIPTADTRSTTTDVDDVFINEDKPAEWKGGDNTLVTRPEALKQKTSLLKFTLPSLAAGDTIDRAFIRVFVTGARPTNHSIIMRRLTTAWTEGTSNADGASWSDPNGTGTAGTWSSGSFSAADYDGTVSYGSYAAPFTADTVLEFDVTDLVRDWRAGTVPNNGVALIASGTDAGDLVFRSSEGDAVATPGARLIVSLSQSGSGTEILRDNFSTVAYSNNDGSQLWAGGWVESGDDGNPNGGDLRINSGILRVANEPGVSIYREANLLDVTSATLTYDLTLNDLDAAGDVVKLQGSTNGGGAWTDIQTFTLGTALTAYSHDLVSVLGSVNEQTQLRFVSISDDGDVQDIEVDNFQISYTTPPGGSTNTTALSAGTALVSGTENVAVTMTVTASVDAVVTPPATLTVSTTGGTASAAYVSGPTPGSGTADADGVTFSYVYQVLSGANIGSVTFSGVPTGPSGFTFGTAFSQSVLTTPSLTFEARVDTPAPASGEICNTGNISANAGAIDADSQEVCSATTATIGDFIWLDSNGDGIQDPGEPGIAGIDVRVYADADMNGIPDGPAVGTDTTDASGNYLLFGLDAGNYIVDYDPATVPPGYFPTTPGVQTVYGLTTGEQYVDADFGLQPPEIEANDSTIGDSVWLDLNEDGVIDTGEAPIANVDVLLYQDVNNNGIADFGDVLIKTQATDANGNYLFIGLYTGNYVVDVDETDPDFPAGVELVSGGSPVNTPPTNGVHVENIVANNTNVTTADFGYNYAGQIGDTVYYDDNEDLVQGDGIDGNGVEGEDGANNATVVLYNDVDGSGTITPADTIEGVTFTDVNGKYLFDNLPPGDYIVKADSQTVESRSTPGLYSTMLSTTGSSHPATLAPGDMVDLDGDFGYIEATELKGSVFHDINHNGIFEASETPLEPVTVWAYGPGADGIIGTPDDFADLVATTTTDTGGGYEFLLPPGDYRLVYDTTDPDALPGVLTDTTTPLEYIVSAVAGAEYSGFDFGVDNPGKIGDTIFADVDSSGTQDTGEAGLANVTVSLYLDNNNDNVVDAGDTLLETQLTDGNGEYLFEGLADGDYVVAVNSATLPAGYQTTSTAVPPTESTLGTSEAGATISGGNTVSDRDFGYPPAVATFPISGTVWKDDGSGGGTAGDGVFDAGESGIPGTTVTISVDDDGPGPNPPVEYVLTTDANGDYSLTGVPAGAEVIITVDDSTLPNTAYVQTGDPDATLDNANSFTMPAAPVTAKDFGYEEQFGSIAGAVVLGDGNGVADGGEPPLPGVTVTLTYAGPDGIFGTADDTTSSTTTLGDGSYSFTNLVPGNYRVEETDPFGYSSLADADGGNPNSIDVIGLQPGENILTRDFEDEDTASIRGYVRYDVDADGDILDPDAGIAGVTVSLYDRTGGGFILVGTAVTDANGFYVFPDLDPATPYWIQETNPDFYLSTGDADGGFADRIITNLVAGEDLTDQNFLDINLISCTSHEEYSALIDQSGVTTNFSSATPNYTLTFDHAYLPFGHTIDPNWAGTVNLNYSQLDALPASDSFVAAGSRITSMSDFAPGAIPTRSGKLYAVYGRGITAFNGSSLGGSNNHLWEVTYDFTGLTNGYLPAGTLFGMVDVDGIAVDGESILMSAVLDGGGATAFMTYEDDAPNTEPGHGRGVYDATSNTYTWNGQNSVSNDSIFLRTTENLTSITLLITQGSGSSSIGLKFVAPVIDSECIEGAVYHDTDDDDTLDGSAGEVGIPGVLITLYTDPNGDGDPSDGVPVASTVTDETGSYAFPMQPAGDYVAVETDPDGFLSDDDVTGSGTDNRVSITVDGVTGSSGHDFLDDLDTATQLYDISGTTYYDGPLNDRTFSGDDVVAAGVTVYLFRDVNGNGITDPGELAGTTTTDLNGDYFFTDLPNGDYIVVQGNLADYQSVDDTEGADTDNEVAVTLNNADAPGNDFLDAQLGTVEGHLYIDSNGNGTQDPGEPDLANITVTVTDAAGTPHIIESDANGDWTVLVVEGPASADVDTSDPDFPAGYVQTEGSDPTAVTVVGGSTVDGGIDGYNARASIGDYVWLDEDGDGVQDAGESGIANRVVTLTGNDIYGNPVSLTTVTDSNGGYRFANLLESDLTGYTISVAPSGTLNPTFDEDSGTTSPDNATTVVVGVGDQHRTADFGYNWAPNSDVTGGTNTGAIGDRVWHDTDGNGLQNPGEAGLSGVSVFLSNAGPDGIFGTGDDPATLSTTTAADGSYIFDDLPAGVYKVSVAPPTNYAQTGDPDDPGLFVPVFDHQTTVPIVLAPGDVYLEADFGYQRRRNNGTLFPFEVGRVGDQIWLDLNGDGIFNGSETGIPGVSVALIQDANQNGVFDAGESIIASTQTDSSGFYLFTGAAAIPNDVGTDDYLVWVNDTAGVLDGLTPTFDSDGTATPNISAAHNLTNTGNLLQDFGYTYPDSTPGDAGTGAIGDTIFLDRDADNIPDVGEGLEGVVVELYDATGTILLATTVTDQNGHYYFVGLVDATYLVQVDPTSLPGTAGQLTNSYDPDGGAANESIVTLAGGNTDLLQDFGYQDQTNPNTLGGTIWNDLNADGTLLGEPNGYNGVTVVLYDDQGNVVGTTTTDSNGDYSFTGLPDGSYTVDVTDTANVLHGLWKSDGTNPGLDNNSQLEPYTVSVSGGVPNTTADFGYYGTPAGLGNFIWEDSNADGIQDGGEPGIPGVEVTLTITWPGGAGTTTVVTTTDGSGFYSFGNLLLDENHDGVGTGEPIYSISVAPPAGFIPTLTDQGGDDTVDSDDSSGLAASVTMGAVNETYDFGFYQLENISGFVLIDRNFLSQIEAGDIDPIPGVTVELYAANVEVIDGLIDFNGDGVVNGLDDGTYYGFNIIDGQVDVDGSGTIDAADDLNNVLGFNVVDGLIDIDGSGAGGTDDDGLMASQTPMASTTTLADGSYSFTGLPPGTYFVKETDPAGFVTTFDIDGGLFDNLIPVTLTSGADSTGNNFYDALSTTYVLLSGFGGSWQNGEAVLRWETSAEVGTIGFFLSRCETAQGDYVPVVDGIIAGLITSPQGGVYHQEDAGVEAGSVWYYRLQEVDAAGKRSDFGPFKVDFGKKTVAAEKAPAAKAHAASADTSAKRKTAHSKRARRPVAGKNHHALRIPVTSSGLQQVDLSSAAAALNTTPAKLTKLLSTGRYQLSRGGESVAYLLNAGKLQFYAAPFVDTFAVNDVYWLKPASGGQLMGTADGGAAAAVEGVPTFEQSSIVEEDHASIINLFSDLNADYWYWDYILAGNATHGSKSLPLPAPAAEAGPARLVVNLHGYTDLEADPEHHAVIALNGVTLAERIWNGQLRQEISVDLPAGLLLDGSNSVTVTGLLMEGVPYGSFAIDGFEITYQRRYEAVNGSLQFTATAAEAITVNGLSGSDAMVLDVSNPLQPLQLENLNRSATAVSFNVTAGSEYLVVDPASATDLAFDTAPLKNELKSGKNAADYVIIVPPGLEAGAELIAEYRRSTGLEVKLVALQDIYDAFNDGLSSPFAIREFLSFAVNYWKVAPGYVLLAGSGTYDYKDYMGLGENLIPPIMVETPFGIFASDSALADLDADGAPDLALGRLPALSNDDLLAQLTKIQHFESSEEAWKEHITLTADNADLGGDFAASSDAIDQLIGSTYSKEQIHLGDVPTATARQQFLSAIANGSGMINYVGHGGTDRVASEGLVLKSDVAGMANSDRPTVLVALTCSLGRFELPGFNSLGEDLVSHEGGGAVAVWAPSGLSINHRAQELGEAFFRAIHQDGLNVMGDAIVRSGRSYGEEDRWLGTIYNLIGDPALKLRAGDYLSREQRSADRGQMTEAGGRKAEVGGRKAEVGSQRSEVGGMNPEEGEASIGDGEVLLSLAELGSGVYLWKTETPGEVGVTVDGVQVPSIVLPAGIAWYVAAEGSTSEVIKVEAATRMDQRMAAPVAGGDVLSQVMDASGITAISVENTDDRVLVLGVSTDSLILDLSRPDQPVRVEAMNLKDKKGGQAFYFSPGISDILIVQPVVIKVFE